MQNHLAYLCLLLPCVTACSKSSSPLDAGVTWIKQGITYEDVTIDLGYRQSDTDTAGALTPLAVITRDGIPVANAMVFCSLVDDAGEGTESATVYEVEGTSAWYTGSPQQADALPCVLRFRIVLPEQPEAFRGEITVPAGEPQ